MSEIIKTYRYLIIAVILGLLGAGIAGLIFLYHHQYTSGYDAGVLAQRQAQADANYQARLDNEAEKTKLERQHAAELAAANADAVAAGKSADRLRGQLNEVRRLASDYSGAVGVSTSARDTVVLLADVLEKSVQRNRDLADYADHTRIAGQLCERQYDSLTLTK